MNSSTSNKSALCSTAASRLGPAQYEGECRTEVNVGHTERCISLAVGALLGLRGLAERGLPRLFLAACGGVLVYRGVTGHCYGFEMLGLDSSEHPDATVIPAKQGGKVDLSVTINRPANELFAFWRDLKNLPRIIRHLKRVDVLSQGRSHWVAEAPFGGEVTWDAELIKEREGEMLAWKSLPGSDLDTVGSIRFSPLDYDRGTVVTLSLKYNPPGGRMASLIAFLSGRGMKHDITEVLRNFKRLMETGQGSMT